jgi:hypothetical protein
MVTHGAYCDTHQFLLDPLGATVGSLSLRDELRLVRLQIHKLVAEKAPTPQILAALRTLAVMARLEDRLQRFGRQ